MTLQEIYDAVLAETQRSDKAALISRSVKAVVLAAHQSDYYFRDRKSNSNVTPSSAGTDVSIQLPTRFRKFNSIELLAVDTGAKLGIPLEQLDPENIYRADGVQTPYYYYVEGDQVKIHGYTAIARLLWIYYENPDLASMGASTWITNTYSEEIIQGAIIRVYRSLGDTTTARSNYEVWLEFLERLRADNLSEEL